MPASATLPRRVRSFMASSRAQELADHARDGLGLLDLGRVPRVGHRLQSRARDALGELVRVDGRHYPVVLAPHEERGRGHAVNALLEPLVGNGPDELTGRTHGPHE